jgi:hypothetical protein
MEDPEMVKKSASPQLGEKERDSYEEDPQNQNHESCILCANILQPLPSLPSESRERIRNTTDLQR